MVTRVNGFSGMDIDSLVKNIMASKRIPLDKMNQNKQALQWQRETYREVNSQLFDFGKNKLTVQASGYRNSAALNTQIATMKDSSGNTVDSASSAVKAEALASANGVQMAVTVTKLATAAKIETPPKSGIKNTDTLATLKGSTDLTEQFKVTINGKTLDFKATDQLSSVLSKINADPDMKVKAAFDDLSGKLILTSKIEGSASKIEIPGALKPEVSGDFAVNNSFLTLFDTQQNWTDKAVAAKGEQAEYSINGGGVLKSDSNSVTHNGVKLTFQGLTADKGPITVTTKTDPTKALETVKTFIEDYNKLINNLNTMIREEKFKDFPPLTEEQRSAMSETDIAAWEKKAKSGVLKNDPFLKTMLSEMRSALQVSGLSSMGISTKYYYENGKLHLDEQKFKEAIESNPQQLTELFLGTGENVSQSIFGKLAAAADKAMDSISKRAGTSKFDGSTTVAFKPESIMGKQMEDYNSRIKRMTTQMSAAENRYYKQFAAMEAAMTKYQSQLSQLTGSVG